MGGAAGDEAEAATLRVRVIGVRRFRGFILQWTFKMEGRVRRRPDGGSSTTNGVGPLSGWQTAVVQEAFELGREGLDCGDGRWAGGRRVARLPSRQRWREVVGKKVRKEIEMRS